MSARRRRRRHHEEEPDSHERWLISYADMITLLMVFFIVLFSMSSLDATKYRAVVESFSEATGGGRAVMVFPTNKDKPPARPSDSADPSASATPTPGPSALAMAALLEQAALARDQIAQEVTEQIKSQGLSRDVAVTVDSRGVVLLLTNSLLFPEASADLLPRGRQVLRKVAPMLASKSRPIVVEGHTDPRPITSAKYPSNWELSTARATNVLRTLIADRVPAEYLTAAGYADTHPRESNASAAGMSANRRVEIILVVTPDTSRPAVAARSQ